MNYQILGLAGQMGAGKDYVFEKLQEFYATSARKVKRVGLADGVRREVTVEVLSAFPGIALGNTDGAGIWAKPYTEGQRALLQWWGTEYRRAQDADYWVWYALDYIAERAEDGDLWVITDVRFKNEAQAVDRSALVTASAYARAERVGISEQELAKRSQHASEVIDFDTDYVIWNEPDPVVEPKMLKWLGLPENCFKCRYLEPHVWHDGGQAFE